jgi:hypothetical protein
MYPGSLDPTCSLSSPTPSDTPDSATTYPTSRPSLATTTAALLCACTNLGSNPGIAGLVDWSVNSQLNEGVGAVHLGFGEGITGAHMDFVIDQVRLS